METISAIAFGAVYAPSAAPDVKASSGIQQHMVQERAAAPVMDEYIPEEKQEPSGRYWQERDEDGSLKICFDDPSRDAREASGERPDGAGRSEEKSPGGGKAEQCAGNTDSVDREIEKLREKKGELSRQINSETDEEKIDELKRELSQVESELRQKDNDAYRRRHTVYS